MWRKFIKTLILMKDVHIIFIQVQRSSLKSTNPTPEYYRLVENVSAKPVWLVKKPLDQYIDCLDFKNL